MTKKTKMYKYFNPNPNGLYEDDCVIRAVSKTFDLDWDSAFLDVMLTALHLKRMPDNSYVWGAYLTSKGYKRYLVPDKCPLCYTVKDFCRDHKNGKYVVATHNHVVAINDGYYFDTWDSGDEAIEYYWKEINKNG